MTDAALVSASIVLSSGILCAAVIASRRSTGQLTEVLRDEVKAIFETKDQIAKTERAVDGAQRAMVALYHDNHALLREVLKREQACIAREQGLDRDCA